MKISERFLVQQLSNKLQHKFSKIYIHKNLAASLIIRRYLKEKLGYIPLLEPEIDMILRDHAGGLNAIEVKLFRSNQTSYKRRFYDGIGQALALHRFGFDRIALWFLFMPDVSIDSVNSYGTEAWWVIQKDLKLPLDFSYIKVEIDQDNIRFRVMQLIERQRGFQLAHELDSDSFFIRWISLNPIRDEFIPKTIRIAIESHLH